MSGDAQFWWNWAVQLLTGLFTFCAVVVALFGNWLRHKLIPPQLQIRLESGTSEEVDVTFHLPSVPDTTTKSRWYHVNVENSRRWAAATHVQVFLVRVEEPNASGQFAVVWRGAIPLGWRHGSFNNALTRTVGYADAVDLVTVFKRGASTTVPFLKLQPLFIPGQLERFAVKTAACRLRVSLQARGLEADSNYLTIEIAWDGTWPEHAKSQQSIVVRELS